MTNQAILRIIMICLFIFSVGLGSVATVVTQDIVKNPAFIIHVMGRMRALACGFECFEPRHGELTKAEVIRAAIMGYRPLGI